MIPCRTAANIAAGNRYRHITNAPVFWTSFRKKSIDRSKILYTKKWSVYMVMDVDIAIDIWSITSDIRTDAGKQAISAGNSGWSIRKSILTVKINPSEEFDNSWLKILPQHMNITPQSKEIQRFAGLCNVVLYRIWPFRLQPKKWRSCSTICIHTSFPLLLSFSFSWTIRNVNQFGLCLK